MSAQAELFDDNPTHREAARAWMAEHPEAMRLFEELAVRCVDSGRRFGIGFITERIRWEYHVERRDEEFKINNNHRAYIARELIRRHPEWEGFIELREVRS